MALKRTGPATEAQEIDQWEEGVGWIAHPEETMQRASHAVVADGEAWVIDPLDRPGLDEMLAELGEVAGVVVLLGRHVRDAEAIADRHEVPVYLPEWVRRSPDGVPVRRFERSLANTDYEVLKLFDTRIWQEAALYDESGGTLVVGDALGTAPYFTADGERLGVNPAVRLFPPESLRGLNPDRVLVGHGRGVFDDATNALEDAITGSRRRYPRLLAANVRTLIGR